LQNSNKKNPRENFVRRKRGIIITKISRSIVTSLNLQNGGESSKNQGKKFDKMKVRCFNCDKYDYYASECWFNKDRKGKNKEQ